MSGGQETKIAVVQAAPVFMDREATVDKACGLIAEAAGNGARLIVFPETFVPAYPDWLWAVPPAEGALLSALHAELLEQSVTVPGDATQRLAAAANEAAAYVVIGINERNVEASGTTLYNTLLYLDPGGRILAAHRKLVPTAAERLAWAQGDGSTLEVYDTPIGRLGGLICWENYMPLARYTLYSQGVQIYVAPTWDRDEPWLSTLRHIGKEAGAYVIGCCQALRLADIPDSYEFKRFYAAGTDWINVGGSAIVDPMGRVIAGPVREREEILYADIDMRKTRRASWMLDVAGHYARPDIFDLTVHREPRPMVRFEGRGVARDDAVVSQRSGETPESSSSGA